MLRAPRGWVALATILFLAACGASESDPGAAADRPVRSDSVGGPADDEQATGAPERTGDVAGSTSGAQDRADQTAEPPGDEPAVHDGVDVSAHEVVDFVTPSGLTRCRLTADSARCDLPTGFAEAALPEVLCWSESNPDSLVAGATVGRYAEWQCADGTSLDPVVGSASTAWLADTDWEPVEIEGTGMATLPFGDTLVHGDFACTAAEDSMRCTGPTGASFAMNTAGVSFEVAGAPVSLDGTAVGSFPLGSDPETTLAGLTGVLGPPDVSEHRAGCPLAGETRTAGWFAQWGALTVYAEGPTPETIEVGSWTLRMGTTAVPVALPGGLSMASTAAEVRASDPGAEQTDRFFGEPGYQILAHDLDFVFDESDHLIAVYANPYYCE